MSARAKQDIDAFCRKWNGVEPYAVATIVKTRRLTSAKAGARAIVTVQGDLLGWVGGGCVQGAVKKVATEVLISGRPRLIRVKPADEVMDSSDVDGVELHKSGCPSEGITDVFIEAVLPKPMLIIMGTSPVALALAQFGTLAGYRTVRAMRDADKAELSETDTLLEGFDLSPLDATGECFIVVATQGAGDLDALKAALDIDATYIAFVASRKKMNALRGKLLKSGCSDARIDRIRAPAGLDIGARGPEELAVSILAEIVQARRASEKVLPIAIADRS